MDIPRGHAMLPLNDADFLDFICNYFKAEYAPIRSFWTTASAEPRQLQRWISMGHELAPLSFRPANAQAQKDLESLDFFVCKSNLDASFVRGIVVRFAKYEMHERLEKKIFECARLDLMVRKALKEKHLIDALWPSPAPRNISQDLLQQGVKVRQWYGDMFFKYFRHLHAIDDFSLRPEIDAKIKSSGMLMLVPFVDHLVFGTVDPILPIVAKGAGFANSQPAKTKQQSGGDSFGEPDRFDIRFDAPSGIEDTYTRSVVRQCQCLKCGSKRDVTVVVSVDPNPGPTNHRTETNKPSSSKTSGPRRQGSKTTQKYIPGYAMPGTTGPTPRSTTEEQPQEPPAETRPASPIEKKQCPRCTFLNHPELTSCEICGSELPDTLVSKPPSPVIPTRSTPSHSHSVSLPPPATADSPRKQAGNEGLRPAAPNRHSLSSTLFSIFPFSQQHQTEHHAHLPPAQMSEAKTSVSTPAPAPEMKQARQPSSQTKQRSAPQSHNAPEAPSVRVEPAPSSPLTDIHSNNDDGHETPPTRPLSQPPHMAMMPLTPPPASSDRPRAYLAGMPQNLMDDFVPVSPSFPREEEEEDAGWGEVSREEARREESDDEDDDDEEHGREGLIDLDAVAREEQGVWGERED
jgi:hypothetical protein